MEAGIIIWHHAHCSASQRALELIRDAGFEPQIIDYLRDPPDRQTLNEVLAAAGLSPRGLLRDKEPTYASWAWTIRPSTTRAGRGHVAQPGADQPASGHHRARHAAVPPAGAGAGDPAGLSRGARRPIGNSRRRTRCSCAGSHCSAQIAPAGVVGRCTAGPQQPVRTSVERNAGAARLGILPFMAMLLVPALAGHCQSLMPSRR